MDNNNENKDEYSYRINVYPVDEEYGEVEWVAEIPDLPGCLACGDTPEEAIKMLEDAQKSWIEIALSDGKKIPKPFNPYTLEFSGKFTLRLPKTLHRDVAIKAEEEGTSLNQYIIYLISKGLYHDYTNKTKSKTKHRISYKVELNTNEYLENEVLDIWERKLTREMQGVTDKWLARRF